MHQAANVPDLEAIITKLGKLQAALAGGLSRERCLRRWSEFIRERDGHRCVDCHSRRRLSAHHICRKSFLTDAQFQTGNGITLCSACHREMHRGFNARPDLSLPVDAQGGEKLATMERLYSILTDDAVERGLMRDQFYFLSDELLATFKRMQGYNPATYFPGSCIEQAYLILAESEFGSRRAMAEDNGVPITDKPLLPGGLYLVLTGRDGQPTKSLIVQTYMPRSKPTTD
ncbi:hypothetical protein LHFGNBLO_004616 [Mesorhizobium sp. AR10]|uniref:hypothetical protein n=1 Tax=Mesorhizobium sp. AR10 TaxID=2865839 RepID=UPI00215FBBF1|nr:hypothetical protein [Mesorhizobium sp. AR10]UVK37560.1 hypothetical protein LHFGNBLO_004616 [Mesorhizobium sp. AR10]